MPGSVTPSRRPRDDRDDGEEDFEVSVDGESPARSHGSKRARLDDEGGQERDEEAQDAPLLPDSFRRSPRAKAKARAVNGLTNGYAASSTPKKHQPGSIVRVTLTDFVTYTHAEFNPGPNLNMVIGPNGTGKSTLVCAICIGLGWSTKHLGRGKDLDEFVKHGAKRGQIEIELAADHNRHDSNPVITTRIKKGDKGNAEYLIDGKKENKKRVQELARSFSIQVDNLCQFLPQDRVVEFAGLSPEDLLIHTQRAAAPQQMSDWHEQLKVRRKEQKAQQAEQQRLAETIKKQEDRQRSQEADVQRLRDRAGLQDRITALEKMRPLPRYRIVREDHSNAKRRRKVTQKELAELERRMQPNLEAVDQKLQYLEVIEKSLQRRKNLTERHEKVASGDKRKIDRADEELLECANDINSEMNSMKTVRQRIPGLQRDVGNIERAMQAPPEAIDAAAMNEHIREKTRQIRDAEERSDITKHEVGSLGEQMRQRRQIVSNAEDERKDLRSQAGQQTNKLRSYSTDAARAWQWIQENRARFEGEVFGPPLIECRVKDQRHAAAVESMIQQSDVLAFTVTTKADFDMLTDELHRMRLHQISVRASLKGLDFFSAPLANDALQQYGLSGWLLDLLEGPEPVLAMLCDNRNIHQTAYTLREISTNQFDALQQSPISSWVTSRQSYMISRRREYGDKATSTRVLDLRQARFFTDVPIDHQQEREIDRRVAEVQGEINELEQSKRIKEHEGKAVQAEVARFREEKSALEKNKSDKQAELSQFNALPTKLQRAQEKLSEEKEKLAGSAERKKAIIRRGDGICLEKGQHALDYAHHVEALRGLHTQQFEAELRRIEASSELEQLKEQHQEEERLINEIKVEVATVVAREAELLAEGQHLRHLCNSMQAGFTEYEAEVWEEIQAWTLDQLETEAVSVTARLESLVGGGNENTLREFEQRAKDIEAKTREFNEICSNLDELAMQISHVRELWEPELDALVGEISEAFAENFSKIQCAGEVGVHKDEDFEHWAIQIKVKFRESEPLSLLDSHRQSGGERAVSTIFYLMALQSLARAPFRVVDEINQGMDPRNERLVHSRMVDIACAEAGQGRQGSQYFLITPKLLQGLKYHPNMKVHCIASGEHMPNDFREVDFASAAKRALELRGRQAGVAAG